MRRIRMTLAHCRPAAHTMFSACGGARYRHRRDTHADKETIGTACGKGFPKPKQTFGELGAGEAYVPPGFEKKARFVIDLTSSKVVPQADFTKR